MQVSDNRSLCIRIATAISHYQQCLEPVVPWTVETPLQVLLRSDTALGFYNVSGAKQYPTLGSAIGLSRSKFKSTAWHERKHGIMKITTHWLITFPCRRWSKNVLVTTDPTLMVWDGSRNVVINNCSRSPKNSILNVLSAQCITESSLHILLQVHWSSFKVPAKHTHTHYDLQDKGKLPPPLHKSTRSTIEYTGEDIGISSVITKI